MQNLDKKIITIMGMPGIGKTTIGKKLASKLNIYFIDLDKEIEDDQNHSISKIFEEKGEEYFRKIESQKLQYLLKLDDPCVLSLGGGTPIYQNNLDFIKENSMSIFLQADIDTILSRVKNRSHRPLLNNPNKRQILQEMLQNRQKFYQKADIIVNSNDLNSDQAVGYIVTKLNEFLKK